MRIKHKPLDANYRLPTKPVVKPSPKEVVKRELKKVVLELFKPIIFFGEVM